MFGRQQRVGTYRRGSAAASVFVAIPVRDHHYDPVGRAVAFDLWRACAAEGYEKGADEESGQNTSHSVTLIGVVRAFRRSNPVQPLGRPSARDLTCDVRDGNRQEYVPNARVFRQVRHIFQN